nr:hypothetical protein [Vibrio crassostreae]
MLSMRAFVPLILSFIPNYAPYVEQGFNALQRIPNPYWFVVGAVVVDTLGMRATYLNTTHHDGKRSDGVSRGVNHCTNYRWSLKPWHDYGFEKGHQLDKASAARSRATDTKTGDTE